MYKNQVGGIVQGLQHNTIQNEMNGTSSHNFDINVDSKIAEYIYNFLIGQTNKLPTIEFLSKYISSKDSKDDIVSIGYGMLVIIRDSKDLEVKIDTPITENTTRVDEISSSSYTAYKANNWNLEKIDVNKSTLFDIRRIVMLQKYFTKYKNFILDSENQNTDSGKML